MTSELSTNYLSPELFKKFCGCINQASNAKLDSARLELLFSIMYYCVLRVSEALNVSKPDINLTRRILRIPKAKTGRKRGKMRADGTQDITFETQETSIPKPLLELLEKNWDRLSDKLFDFSRQSVWLHAKRLGEFAGLNIYERQKKREIVGVWTHLFRKSYAKWMYEKGASGAMIDVKLRHEHKSRDMADSTFTYIKPDINALIKWEADNHG